jgi:hypothetical protein
MNFAIPNRYLMLIATASIGLMLSGVGAQIVVALCPTHLSLTPEGRVIANRPAVHSHR